MYIYIYIYIYIDTHGINFRNQFYNTYYILIVKTFTRETFANPKLCKAFRFCVDNIC